jgi:hypothetical protein
MVPMPPAGPGDPNGFGAMVQQFGPLIKTLADRIKPFLDQPVIRFPYNLPLARSAVIGAGLTNQPLIASDFSNSLEWPFEVNRIKFSNDPAHTFRDWRVLLKDQTFNQDWMRATVMVATMVGDNTGAWDLDFPWVVRPKGGGISVMIDNLDTVNPITVDINFQGFLLIPRA